MTPPRAIVGASRTRSSARPRSTAYAATLAEFRATYTTHLAQARAFLRGDLKLADALRERAERTVARIRTRRGEA